MGNLNSAIKRIENKGKQSVNPKKNEMAEVAPAVAAVGKAALVAGKAIAKGAAAGAKAGAKGAKVAAKTGAKATKKVSSTASSTASRMASAYDKMKKPASRNVVRRNVKNPRYKKLEKDDKGNIVRGKEFDKKLYDQDGNKKTQDYMSAMDGPTDKRSTTYSGENRQKKKEEDGQEKRVQDTVKSLKKGVKTTGDVAKKTVKKTGEYAKKSVSATTSNFGASSFAKEGITFKEYLNKL